MTLYDDADPPADWPPCPRRSRDSREAIRHQGDPEWRPEHDDDGDE